MLSHAAPPPLPVLTPPAIVALDRARATWRAAGDQPTSRPGVAFTDREATLVQAARAGAARRCPRPLPGLPAWRTARPGAASVLCVLAYRNHTMRVRIEYRRTPADRRASLLVRVVVL